MTPSPVPGNEDVHRAGHQAVTALRALNLSGARFRAVIAEHFGIGVTDSMAMGYLSLSGPMSASQLANALGLTSSTVTTLLDRLEAAGLAARSPHPTDRRRTVVTGTVRGEQMLARTDEYLAQALEVFGAERLGEIAETISALGGALERQAGIIAAADARAEPDDPAT